MDWDFLTNFQDRFCLFVNTALGDRRPLDGPYDFSLGMIQAVDVAFDAAVLVPVGGVLVKLGVDLAAKAGTGYFMIQCHSMSAVLWGLLVEENLVGGIRRNLLGYDKSKL